MKTCLPKDSRQSGETIVEYVLMLALIFLVVLFAGVTIGERASSVFNRTGNALINIIR